VRGDLDDRMARVSGVDRNDIEENTYRPYRPSIDIINKFEENALKLGVTNPYYEAEPVIEAIGELLSRAPLSLEKIPEIEIHLELTKL